MVGPAGPPRQKFFLWSVTSSGEPNGQWGVRGADGEFAVALVDLALLTPRRRDLIDGV
jgi:hypothetical protein